MGSDVGWMAGHDWAKTTDSLKWYLREEDPWYCQPCCHSPGSTPLGCGGLTPPLNSLQLGRPTNPLLSRMPAASSKSLRHPCGLAFKTASTLSVNSGRRANNMGKASAHEAQQAAGAVLDADQSPKPPNLIGKVANWRPSSQHCLHSLHHSLVMVVCVLGGLVGRNCAEEMVASWHAH